MGCNYCIIGAFIWSLAAIVLCAYFRTFQLALTRTRPRRLRELGNANKDGWKKARHVRFQAGQFLLAAHIGYFIGVLTLGIGYAFAARELIRLIANDLAPVLEISLIVVFASVMSVVPLMVLQLVRAVAFSYPEETLIRLAPSMMLVYRVMAPATVALDGMMHSLSAVIGLEAPCEREIAVPPEELLEIVEIAEEERGIQPDERDMLKAVVSMSDKLVREVMTPRADIIYVEMTATFEEVRKLFIKEQVSRILVVGNSLDEVRGVVHAKDLLPYLSGVNINAFALDKLMRPPCFVPGARVLDDVLRELRKQAIHFAVVTDEHGGVDGVVTVEDLLEEIVGEIFDEFDSPAEEEQVKSLKDGDVVVDASITIDEFNERFRRDIPYGEYDTVAGFVLSQLGRIPEVGEIVEVQGLRFKIEELDQNRLISLRLLRKGKLSLAHPQKSSVESNRPNQESKSLEVSKEPKLEVLGSR